MVLTEDIELPEDASQVRRWPLHYCSEETELIVRRAIAHLFQFTMVGSSFAALRCVVELSHVRRTRSSPSFRHIVEAEHDGRAFPSVYRQSC